MPCPVPVIILFVIYPPEIVAVAFLPIKPACTKIPPPPVPERLSSIVPPVITRLSFPLDAEFVPSEIPPPISSERL